MLIIIWLVLFLVASSVLLLPLALWRREIHRQYSGSRLVSCPENQRPVVVSIDTQYAAATGIDGCPRLQLSACTRWPERANCDQACLSEAVQVGAYKPAKRKTSAKQIYHLPIALAAFAAWYLGAIWHSRFAFRTRWVEAIGLDPAQFKLIIGLYLLLSLAVCVLFAYGVAWLLAVRHRKGIIQGILMAALLSGSVIAVEAFQIQRLPHDFLVIETGYTVLTLLIVGAIVGGLYDKLVVAQQTQNRA